MIAIPYNSSQILVMNRFSRWLAMAEMLVPPLPWDRSLWRDNGGPTVVLLHGLLRGRRAMQPVCRVLGSEGFSTLNVPYPSNRLPIQDLAARIRIEVGKITTPGEPVHFVTHSLGGIIVRTLLADPVPWTIGRIVMLAPPNNGSEIVDWSVYHPLLRILLGPAGRALGTGGFPSTLPRLSDEVEAAVIMGNHSGIPFFKKLLNDENDGIVSTSRGSIPGLRGFAVVEANHTFIHIHPETIRLCVSFLKNGSFC